MDELNNSGMREGGKREDVCPSKKGKLDLESVRERIEAATAHDTAEKTGPEYWRAVTISRMLCIANFPKALPSGSIPFPAAASSR